MFYDVEPFWFYVLIEKKRGDVFTTVGYFSKEKNPVIDYTLSCIMDLSAYMGKGYGKFLIDLSYGLSRQEGIFGSPERPLSDLGLISYRSYWKDILINHMFSLIKENSFSVRELSLQSGILQNDIVSTLQSMQILKYWRGNHIILQPTNELKERLKKFKLRCNQSKIKLRKLQIGEFEFIGQYRCLAYKN